MRRVRFDNLKNAALFDAENPVCKAGRYSTDSQRVSDFVNYPKNRVLIISTFYSLLMPPSYSLAAPTRTFILRARDFLLLFKTEKT